MIASGYFGQKNVALKVKAIPFANLWQSMEKLHDKWLRITGLFIHNIFFFSFFYLQLIVELHEPFWKVIGWQILFTFVIWESTRQSIIAVRKRLPGIGQVLKRTVVLAAILFVLAVGIGCWHVWMEDWLGFWTRNPINVFNFLYSIGMTLFFSMLIAGMYESVYFLNQWKKSFTEAEDLKKINLQSQLDSLKNQVSPHFLFNSLNSLTALVEEDPKRAVRFIEELSNVYRYLLQSNEKELIPLNRELDFIYAYFYLLKTRFEDGLHLEVAVDERLNDYLIPPLTLQILVENAVKHNMVSAGMPLCIQIYTDEKGYLLVRNNIQLRKTAIPSNKMGLVNISAKYRLLNQGDILIRQTDTHFEVTAPLIRMEYA